MKITLECKKDDEMLCAVDVEVQIPTDRKMTQEEWLGRYLMPAWAKLCMAALDDLSPEPDSQIIRPVNNLLI